MGIETVLSVETGVDVEASVVGKSEGDGRANITSEESQQLL